jgi:hypothetical protein
MIRIREIDHLVPLRAGRSVLDRVPVTGKPGPAAA